MIEAEIRQTDQDPSMHQPLSGNPAESAANPAILLPESLEMIPRSALYLEGTPISRAENARTAYNKFHAATELGGRGLVEKGREIPYTEEGLAFVEAIDLAQRAANGLRLNMVLQSDGTQSQAGILLDRALENPKLADHNHWHFRRTEQMLLSLLLNTPELQTAHTRPWIDSAILFASRHDDDQLISLQRNLENPALKLKVKKGHAVAGAVMMLCHAQQYADERMIPLAEAERICAGAAYMIMKHDEPEKLQAALAGNKDAKGLHGSDLLLAFERNELDLQTISKSQLMEVLFIQKSENGFVNEQSTTGLLPAFEQEHKAKLAALSADNSPLLALKDVQDVNGLKLMTEAAIYPDAYDMVAPPVEGILRTLATQYSGARSIVIQNTPEFRAYVNSELVAHKRFKISDTASREDYYEYLIRFGEGNIPDQFAKLKLDSDARRLLMEFLMFVAPAEQTNRISLNNCEYPRKVTAESALMGILAVKEFGSRLLQADFTVIDESVRVNQFKLAQKRLKQLDFRAKDIHNAIVNSGVTDYQTRILSQKELDNFINFVNTTAVQKAASATIVASKKIQGQQASFKEMIENMAIIGEHTKESIAKKPLENPDNLESRIFAIYKKHLVEVHSQDEVDFFQRVCDRILVTVRAQCYYEGIDDDIKEFEARVRLHEYPKTTPYYSYIGMGQVDQIRTILKPRRNLVA